MEKKTDSTQDLEKRVKYFMKFNHESYISEIKEIKYIEPTFLECGCCRLENESYEVYLNNGKCLCFDWCGHLMDGRKVYE